MHSFFIRTWKFVEAQVILIFLEERAQNFSYSALILGYFLLLPLFWDLKFKILLFQADDCSYIAIIFFGIFEPHCSYKIVLKKEYTNKIPQCKICNPSLSVPYRKTPSMPLWILFMFNAPMTSSNFEIPQYDWAIITRWRLPKDLISYF